MAVIPKHLANAVGTASPVSIYTVPVTVLHTAIRSITVTRAVGDPASPAFVWLVPSGGSPDSTNRAIPGIVPKEPGVVQDDGVHVLETGGKVYAQGLGLSFIVDGAEVDAS